MVSIETTPDRAEELKRHVEDALTFAAITGRDAFVATEFALNGHTVTDEERDVIVRQVSESIAEICFQQGTIIGCYEPVIKAVKDILTYQDQWTKSDILSYLDAKMEDVRDLEEDEAEGKLSEIPPFVR